MFSKRRVKKIALLSYTNSAGSNLGLIVHATFLLSTLIALNIKPYFLKKKKIKKRFARFLSKLLPASVDQSNARPTGDLEVVGSIPVGSGNIFVLRLIY